uniref:Uncharacterized protein LOC104217919 n=1 Tax=Nicotiana sylvestris TaxID=4096 RepID=A0A1U7VNN2_NICSY|nr:PREDICTED: uncharacterized protein LOC104217919 [Nicotiana sylvestris]
MEVYIDDMLVKSQQIGDHIQYLTDTFQILRKFSMKLNPEKCAFGVSSSKFLGFLVSNHGIEVNPAHIKVIEEIPNILTSKKEVQRLTRRIAALGRFISKSSEKCFKFLLALKKHNQFEWPEECQQVLKNLKTYLSNPPFLAKSKDGKKLFVYLAVSEVAVSVVLVREDQGSSNVKGAGLGIVLAPPMGETIRQAIKCHPITNNEAEYVAVIAGLELARELRIEQVVIKRDSQLVVNQMQGTYTVRETRMQQHLEKERDLVSTRSRQKRGNYNNLTWDWRNEIVNFLQHEILPEDKKKAQALRKKVARYCLKQGNLYRKMFAGPLVRCLGPSQIEYVMREIHEGHCGNHAGGRSLVKTMIRADYYWPKMEEDAEYFVAKCDKKKGKYTNKNGTQKQVIERYYNRKARLRYFKIGDYVLKKVFQSTRAANAGKLSPTWEGPYKVHGIAGKGAYELETLDGKILPSNWNDVHLKRYYF